MLKFDKSKTQELKDFLYNSYIHDAGLEIIRYECGENRLKVETFNPIFNVKINLTFHDVRTVFAIRGNDSGSSETIVSLTAEEDFSYLHNCFPKHCKSIQDSIYLLFQTFSGDEFHIVSREVFIEVY